MIQWLIIIVWVLSAIAVIVLLPRRRDWRWKVPRHRVRGFRCEVGSARIVEDNIVRQVWAVPIVFTNEWHRPARLPRVDQVANVRSSQRTRILHRAFRYRGMFSWADASAASGGEANPGATVTASVRVELAVDEVPEAFSFTTRRRRGRPVRYGAGVPLVEITDTADVAEVIAGG